MKRPSNNPCVPRTVLAAQVDKARQSETTALQALLDRKAVLLEQARREPDPSTRKRCMSKLVDLDDAIRLRKRELDQLYPNRIKKIARAQTGVLKSSQNKEAIAKVTWAKPYRG